MWGDSGSAIVVDDEPTDDKTGNVVLAIHSYGPQFCSTAGNDKLFRHVSVSAAADFVVLVVCHGIDGDEEAKAEWCPPMLSDTSIAVVQQTHPYLHH